MSEPKVYKREVYNGNYEGVLTDMVLKSDYDQMAQAMRFWEMRGGHSSFCPNHSKVKGVAVDDKFTIHDITVDAQYFKCPIDGCDMTWLSGRQESDIDVKIKNGLLDKIKTLEALCLEGLQSSDSIEWHMKVNKEVVNKK